MSPCKTVQRSFFLFLFCYASFSLNAADFIIDGIAYNIASPTENTCIVTSPGKYQTVAWTVQFGGSTTEHKRPNMNLYSGRIIIPQNPEYKGRKLTVVGIDNCAFYVCENLLSVTIPPTVQYIGAMAFYGCSNLTNIYGDINASIGSAAFAGCKSLRNFMLKRCDFISHQAFLECSSLTVLSIPSMVSRIGEEAFAKCGRFSKVVFKDGQSDLSLYMDVFKDSPIDNLYIGRNLAYYSNSQDRRPFDRIIHLIIGDSVTSINQGITLYDVSGFGFSRLLDELKDAYNSVFDLSGLKSIVLGRSLSQVPAFEIAKLESITCRASTPHEVKGSFSYYVILNSTLYVPKGAKKKYEMMAPWKDFLIKEKTPL